MYFDTAYLDLLTYTNGCQLQDDSLTHTLYTTKRTVYFIVLQTAKKFNTSMTAISICIVKTEKHWNGLTATFELL